MIKNYLSEREYLAQLRNFMLEKSFGYGYEKYNFHLRSLLNWHRYEQIINEIISLSPRFVLDVGCGFGQITEMLHVKGIRAIGIDIGVKLKRLEKNKVWKNLCAPFALGDACNLPFKSETFDVVVCCGVLEHVYDQYKFSKECRRVLKNDGFFLCYYLPNKTGLESIFSRIFPTGHKFYTKASTEYVLNRSGFRVLNIKREQVIPSLFVSDSALKLQNKLRGIVLPLDDVLNRTPFSSVGQNWKVVCAKNRNVVK